MYLYHVTPLHYLPHILQSGAVYAKSILAARGIAPRSSAVRRDRMLGLADWVHLSLFPNTPLLRDKLAKGYPHALLVFDRESVLALPGVALLPYNTKAWRSRSACQPVTDPEEKALLLRRHTTTGRHPSLEALIHYGLDLTPLVQIAFATEAEHQEVGNLHSSLRLPVAAPLAVNAVLFPLPNDYVPATGMAIAAYFADCRRAGTLLPPPPIPFD